MMSSENLPPTSLPENQSSSGNNNNSKGVAALPPEQPLKCPRCDSSNTKFCYYNNYSLSQPRHFCKTCRRYWTRGGALRNVPIGGGCRKSKKFKSSAVAATTATSRLFEPSGEEFGPGPGPGPGFKLMSSGPGPGPVEFQLGGLSLPRLHPATAGVYTQYITNAGSGPGFGLDLFGSNYPAPTTATTTAVSHHPISLSSIESLSSMNQEMHWKLQQQRLALIYGGDHDHDHESHQIQNHKEMKPIAAINLFQQLEICSNNSNNNNNSGAYNNTTTTTTTNNNNNISTPKLSTECGNEINTGGPGSGRKEEVGPTEWFFDPTNQENGCATVIATSQEVEPTVVAFDGVRPVIATTTTTTTTTDGAASWGDFQFNGFH